jgi:hypothetical protein
MEGRCKYNIKVGNKCRMVVDSHWCGYDNNDAEHSNFSTEARVIQRPVGKHVVSMKAASFHDDEPRLVSHCRNVKARIYPCERIQKRHITRLSNLFLNTSWLSSCLASLQIKNKHDPVVHYTCLKKIKFPQFLPTAIVVTKVRRRMIHLSVIQGNTFCKLRVAK